MVDFGYKSAEFYTQYFDKHPDFKVLESFQLSEDKAEQNTFVGRIKVLNTIYPLELRVEIPVSFPHHKLTFRTKSLSGYPHLIHSGKIQYGDWFCLNTPFAETAEGQLQQEIFRLKDWINKYMNEALPAHIKDSDLHRSLSLLSIISEVNPDTIKIVQTKAMLSFIGNFADVSDNFSETIGTFHCLRTKDNRLYAFKDKYPFTTYELPYIIIDAIEDYHVMGDFFSLRDYYGWDEQICKHLLPGYDHINTFPYSRHSFNDGLNHSLDDALKLITQVRAELAKEEPYLNPSKLEALLTKAKNEEVKKVYVKASHRNLILKELDIIEESVRNNNGVKTKRDLWHVPIDEWTEEENEEQAKIDDWFEHGRYVFDYFALGIKSESKIQWIVFWTNHASLESEQITYNVEIGDVSINKNISLKLNIALTQTLDDSMFFGRGALCNNIRNKKIALIGLGAIGSMVAEALAHAGVSKIGLWDSDVIEPGNICRSSYHLQDIGESKVQATARKIRDINPFIETKDLIKSGYWSYRGFIDGEKVYRNGSFYDNINYTSQEDAISQIKDYDLIIDCTGRNEILHFISYALSDSKIISLAITNKAKELLCITNQNGNPFEIRKAYLSAIAQDTTDYYAEGSGCYEPTFKATYFDICSLVNLCIRELNSCMDSGKFMTSTIYRYNQRGIVNDRINTYRLQDSDIILNIPNEVLMDAEDLPESFSDYLGFIFGTYSKDGKQIMVTHIVEPDNAQNVLENAFSKSQGIIDYIGDVAYSEAKRGSIKKESYDDIAAKAMDKEINTNNPLLAIRNPEGDFSFYLFINGELIPFNKIDD